MPPYPKQPVVDTLNPCYCPSLPARAYIHNLRQEVATNSSLASLGFPPLHPRASNPFTKRLAGNVSTPGIGPGDKGVLDSDSDTSSISMSTSSSLSSGASTTVSDDATSASSSSNSQSSSSAAESISHVSTQQSTFESGSGEEEEQFYSVSGRSSASINSAVFGYDNNDNSRTGSLANDATTLDSSHMYKNPLLRRFNGLRDSHLLARPPRKRKELHTTADSDGDSDLRGPSKHIKSVAGSVQRSFEVRLTRETLRFDDIPSSSESNLVLQSLAVPAQHLERTQDLDGNGGQLASPELMSWLLSPRLFAGSAATAKNDKNMLPAASLDEEFMEKVKQAAPMIRIPGSANNPQTLTRYLGKNGLLTTPLMRILGMSDVQELLLGPSLQDHNGLNIGPPNLFPELHGHGTFKCLVKLSCDNAPLKDDNIVNLHGLPLQELSLNGTSLSNAAIFVLIPLRNTLIRFSISGNPAINNDVIPALMMFLNLKLLVLRGTHIEIEGLRRFAENIHSENRRLKVEIPLHCRYYLDHMRHYYLLHPAPPLLSAYDREEIWGLQLVDLRKNLAAHGAVNREVLTTGNKADLRERLGELLLRRKGDMMVKKMYEDGLLLDERMSFESGTESGEEDNGGE
ncbi:hypothetical protein D9756_002912 [Leucocoprinus leucothites]|uniref:Uncharacterized protein n=1 Tax=Leucocoprinus leucothites TaxID=201217 RepID=A0A8H5G758_9AGAR|nr:hypothetical protein D9756_002912 [Leucoagaricus leucothites]